VTTIDITGIRTGETIRGLDYRPATEQVFAITAPTGQATGQISHTYILNVDTGVARPVGSSAAIPGFGDVVTAYDFNPNVDRLRVSNVNDENFRLNPNDGSLAADDPNINPETADIIEVAYDRNDHTAGSVSTTLFGLNRATSSLARVGGVNQQPSANTGTVTDIGPLGVTPDAAKGAGFDISVTGIGHAAITSGGVTRYHVINLTSGSAGTGVPIGDGTSDVVGLTRVPDSQRVLYSEFDQDRYSRVRGTTLRTLIDSTLPGTATVRIVRNGTTLRTVTGRVIAGSTRLTIGKVPLARGSYSLLLTVTNEDRTATDIARLRVTRPRG
jgi:hypothetical protein